MIGKEEKSRKLISLPEALEVLEKRKKAGALGYEQELAYDHAKKFAKLDAEDAKKLRTEMEKQGISEKAAIMVVNVMPAEQMQLKQILAYDKATYDEEIISKTMEAIAKASKK